MYLSRVEIRPQLRATRHALSSPQRLHAIVAASFPTHSFEGGSQRPLWRLDRLGHSLYLLIASTVKPDFAHLIEQLGWGSSQQTWETKAYGPFLEHLQQGQKWQFRLRANPTHSVKRQEAPRDRGIVYPCVRIDKQKQWLATRAQKYGFSLDGFELMDRDVRQFERQGEKVTLHLATFEGLLTVENPVLLREALIGGIGRAKAYGCGLLTLAKPYVGA